MTTIIKIYKDGSRKGFNAITSIDVPEMFQREKALRTIQILFGENGEIEDALEFHSSQFKA